MLFQSLQGVCMTPRRESAHSEIIEPNVSSSGVTQRFLQSTFIQELTCLRDYYEIPNKTLLKKQNNEILCHHQMGCFGQSEVHGLPLDLAGKT